MSLKNDLSKYKPRKEQKEALDFIDSEYQKNKLTKFFLLNLPVGSGKSHLALMIADWYRKNVTKMSMGTINLRYRWRHVPSALSLSLSVRKCQKKEEVKKCILQ